MADELPRELGALLARTSELDGPSGADRERVFGKLKLAVPLLGVAVPLATEGVAAASLGKGAWSWLGLVTHKVFLGGVVLAVAGGATYQAVREPEPRPLTPGPDLARAREFAPVATNGAQSSVSVPSAALEVTPGPAAAERGARAGVVAQQNREQRARSGATSRAPNPGNPGLGNSERAERAAASEVQKAPRAEQNSPVSEVELLAEAQRALSSGASERALALALEHQRRFPGSGLLTERLAVEILAYCGLKRPGEAEARLTQFRRMAPNSPLRPRLEASCAGSSSRADLQTIPELSGH